jgi:hypothetical protein
VQLNRLQLAAGLATVLLAVLIAPTAAADGKVPLGGGAGIIVGGETYCTLTTIGHDGAGELIGFTSKRCGGVGSQVVAEGSGVVVGNAVAVGDDLSYLVIKLDPTKVAPVAAFDGFAINGIGPDPGLGQGVCTHGGASGDVCGSVLIPSIRPSTLTVNMPVGQWHTGDEGEPFAVDGLLVGMSPHGFSDPLRPITHAGLTLFSAILADVNAKGGPGVGFSPVAG